MQIRYAPVHIHDELLQGGNIVSLIRFTSQYEVLRQPERRTGFL